MTWNSSFISSSKEKKIVFEIKEEKNESKSYGRAELYFSSLRSKPEQEFAGTNTIIQRRFPWTTEANYASTSTSPRGRTSSEK